MLEKLVNFLARLFGYLPSWMPNLLLSWYEKYLAFKGKQWLEEHDGEVRKIAPEEIAATTHLNAGSKAQQNKSPLL